MSGASGQDPARMAQAIERVRAIHAPVEAVNFAYRAPRVAQVCAGCGTDAGNWQTYPCPTIRAIEREKP